MAAAAISDDYFKGSFFQMAPTATAGGADMDAAPLREQSFAYQNPHFVRTMALVTDTNLMNGILRIPFEVCVAARLPVWKGPPEPDANMLAKLLKGMDIGAGTPEAAAVVHQWQEECMADYKDAARSTFFYAVPINHVLAWGYHSEEYRAQQGHRVEEFRFTPPSLSKDADGILLYYLVPDGFFEPMVRSFHARWMGKVDVRPLASIGFEFGGGGGKATGFTVAMRAYLKFFSVPRGLPPATVAKLAPTLDPDFPPCHMWSVDEVARQMAIERHAQEQLKASKPAK
jgi:hypothetical protein